MTAIAARPASLSTAPRPRTRRARTAVWHAAATVVIWLTSLFVVALWVLGGGVTALLGVNAESLTTLGRLTGLVASNLLLYQVLLMARVPLFERGFGRDGITRMHRVVGFWSFWLMLVHIALLVAGYAASAGVNPFAQLWDFIWNYPGMLLATVATLLLVMVVITSIRRARRRMRYESWHLLHLYAYLGVGLALPHQLWTGADFLSSPAATAYWWGLWAVAAASVVAFRIVLPLTRSMRHRIRVTSVRPDGARGVTVRMAGRGLEHLHAKAGQFFVWRFVDGPGWTRGHPFSLSGTPRGGELAISARFAGDGSRRLADLKPGTRVLVEGPYGHLTGDVRTGDRLLMIGAGAGVAPLVSLLEDERWMPGNATLIVRDSESADALLRAEIDDLVATRGLQYVPLPGRRAPGASAWIPESHRAWQGADVIRHLTGGTAGYDAYVCGPPAWMDAVVRDLKQAGLPAARIHTESFTI